eukprot:scaffold213044_cov31-Tisochrysis_lutea.AAC.2
MVFSEVVPGAVGALLARRRQAPSRVICNNIRSMSSVDAPFKRRPAHVCARLAALDGHCCCWLVASARPGGRSGSLEAKGAGARPKWRARQAWRGGSSSLRNLELRRAPRRVWILDWLSPTPILASEGAWAWGE